MHDVALDASVLINFLILDRSDILGTLPKHRFFVPARVREEVTRPEQQALLSEAFRRKFVWRTPSPTPAEMLLAVDDEMVVHRIDE